MITQEWANVMVSSVITAKRDLRKSFQMSTTLLWVSAPDQHAPNVIRRPQKILRTLIRWLKVCVEGINA